jgi:hypothetical protein
MSPEAGTDLDVQKPATATLRILQGLFDKLGSSRGAEVVVSGAVAGIVAVGGWPGVTAYGLTMAAWMGKDTFEKAIEKALDNKTKQFLCCRGLKALNHLLVNYARC